MKIVILDAKTLGNDIDLSIFSKFGELTKFDTTSEKEKLQRIKGANIIITNKVIMDKKVMDFSKDLKLICLSATGTNNVDLKYAKQKGIEVKNVSDYSTNSVTQHTFALLFALIEHISYYDKYVKNGEWVKSEIFTNLDKTFFEIANKNWGIIGLGNIGLSVAKVAQTFGANVSYFSTSGKNTNSLYKQVSLEELLENSDIISIHSPLNANTLNLIDKTELTKMKKNAILINVARGGIVNENALFEAIENEQIYAALDVLENEPMNENSILRNISKKDRIIFTPHIAWASKEARKLLVQRIYNNIENFIKG